MATNFFNSGQSVVLEDVSTSSASSTASNFFDVSQSVIQALRYIPQYATKPDASSLSVGTIVFDTAERAFYEATVSGWVEYEFNVDELTAGTLNFTTGSGTSLVVNDLSTTTLNGESLSYYTDWVNTTNKPDPTITLSGDASGSVTLTDLSSGVLSVGVTESGVTQHEAAISISASQVTDFTTAVQGVVTEAYVESLGVDAVAIDYDSTGSNLTAINVQAAIDELNIKKVDIASLTSNITLYFTDVSASVTPYFELVTSVDDPSYPDPAVDLSTSAITTTDQLVAGFVSEPGLIDGNPGVIALTTIGQIRKASGSGTAKFYFKVFQRTSGGTETELAQSGETIEIDSSTFTQYAEYALLNNGTFLLTDRIVIKWYATRVAGGSDPTYEIRLGGSDPTRTLFPVPVSVIPAEEASGVIADTTNFDELLSASDDTVQKALDTLDDHTHASLTDGVVTVSASGIDAHISDTSNPHSVTAAQVNAVSLAGDTMSGDLTVPNIILDNSGTIGSAGDTDAISFDSVGVVTFSQGIKMAASKGINFSAYGSGTDIDSNLLNDYEEGTWDPTYVLGTSGTATVDGATVGTYVKVGNAVHVTCRIGTASINSPTGSLKIDGLPFTSKATGGLSGAALGVAHSWATSNPTLRAYVADNDDRISLVKNATNVAFSSVVGSDLDSGSGKNLCVLQLTYLVD